MKAFFKAILYTPFLNALIFLYNIVPGHDFGVAIILLTVIIRAILFPLSIRAQRSQRALNLINPKLQELKEKHKGDQAAQGKATMELYKEHGVNPFAGCLPLLIQLPILIALYQAFIAGLNTQSLSGLYSFVHNPGTISTLFLGFINLSAKNRILAIIAGVLQYIQARQSTKYMQASGTANPQVTAMNKQMLYFLPVVIVVLGWNLASGLVLYWITTTICSMAEQWYLSRTTHVESKTPKHS